MSTPNQPYDLTPDEQRRYARHLTLPHVGPEGQRKLKQARVLIAGAGGLGSASALYLAAAGVGRLGLVDFDVVDASNLQRQVIHGESTLGLPKVESAARRLRDLNPHIAVETYHDKLTSHNALDVLSRYDVVVDGTDNFAARYLLNDACMLTGKPLIYGAVYRFEGQVSVFGLPGGPCYRCLLPEPPPPGSVPSCAEAGVLGVLPGTIGTLQATEALKLVLGAGEPLAGRLLLYDALAMTFDTIRLPKRADCPACGAHPTITLIDYETYCSVDHATDPQPAFQQQSARQVKARLDAGERLLLLDVREPYELQLSALDGALNVPMSEMAARWSEIPREQPVVVFCHTGVRSASLIDALREVGYTNLINMAGGIDAWSREVDSSVPRY